MRKTKQNKRTYKMSFILDTRKLKGTLESLFDELKKIITAGKGTPKQLEDLGQKNFARITDRKFPDGHYIQIYFDGLPDSPATIIEKFRLHKNVYRVLVETL